MHACAGSIVGTRRAPCSRAAAAGDGEVAEGGDVGGSASELCNVELARTLRAPRGVCGLAAHVSIYGVSTTWYGSELFEEQPAFMRLKDENHGIRWSSRLSR